jgi:hypothetical protein
MTDEEYEATPDIRAFGFEITENDRAELLDFFAEIARCINEDISSGARLIALDI